MDNYKVDIQAEQFSSFKTVLILLQKCLGYDTETMFYNDCLVCERLNRHLKERASTRVNRCITYLLHTRNALSRASIEGKPVGRCVYNQANRHIA